MGPSLKRYHINFGEKNSALFMRLQEDLKQRKKIFYLYQLLLMPYLSLPMGCALTDTVERERVRETGELLKTTGRGGERGCAAQLSSGLVF